jgi:hypothetical protein
MNECSKAAARRMSTAGFVAYYLVGDGLNFSIGSETLSNVMPLLSTRYSVISSYLSSANGSFRLQPC